MTSLSDRQYLITSQYADATNLNSRINLHTRFSVNPYGWFQWLFDHMRLPDMCHVIELGCGSGGFWLNNQARLPDGWRLRLSDLSEGMLEQARRSLTGISQIKQFMVIDASHLPFGDRGFDAVIANHMLYHVPERLRALSEFRRVLGSSGVLYTSTGGNRHLHEMVELIYLFNPALAEEFISQPVGFTLETGSVELSEWFNTVNTYLYPNFLRVTEAAPLADYILSATRIKAVYRIDQNLRLDLIAFLESQLALRGGVIEITIASGLFEAY